MTTGIWQRNMVSWMLVVALLPVAAALWIEQDGAALLRFGVALVTILIWQAVFLIARAQPLSPIAVVTAFAVALLASGITEAWQIVLAVSFGTVVGEQIFGGWGRNFIHAGVVALAFLYFAFPEVAHQGTGIWVAISVLPGAALLLLTGILSGRVMIGAVVGLVVVTLVMGADPGAPFLQGSLVFGMVFLVADPVCSASTRGGRWLYGGLAGALIALLGWADVGIAAPQAVVFAALLAAIFAPLIDAGIIAATTKQWREHNA
ncbi:RnfABCDGE type electron transport complex subunit D [Maritalea myrionectae]|uniref:RnfABCDGE type electron transport complex subunit D n=1 Tax=Maritalea myrionectae TaxID=454601 RepID=UPI000686D646|nr:RnfABCDGE type electron transport complex subunit D [Maritalea myrionectae]